MHKDQLSGKETRANASKVAGFGNHETCRQAKMVVEMGSPELVAKMDSGKITINAAYKEIQNDGKEN